MSNIIYTKLESEFLLNKIPTHLREELMWLMFPNITSLPIIYVKVQNWTKGECINITNDMIINNTNFENIINRLKQINY